MERQADNMVHAETAEENQRTASEVFSDVCEGKRDSERTFNDTVNHFVNRGVKYNGNPYYVCEATNPESYIEQKESEAEYNGERYIRTDFRVFNNGAEQKSDICEGGGFNDGRFDGRPKGYWESVRKEMKEKGGFSDDMVVFASESEFKQYQALYNQSLKESTVDASHEGAEYRDYSDIQDQLGEQLVARSAALDINGQAVDVNSGVVFDKEGIRGAGDREEELRRAECAVIARQIENYKKMNAAQVELSIAKNDYATVSDEATKSMIMERMTKAEEKYAACEKLEGEYTHIREELSSVDAINDIDEGHLQNREGAMDIEHDKSPAGTRMDEYKERIAERRESRAAAKNTPSSEKTVAAVTKDER